MLHVHVTSCLQSSDPKLINTHTHTTCLNSRFPGKLRLTSCTLNSLPLSILKRDCRNNNWVATTTVFCRPDALPVTQPTLMPVVHTHTHTHPIKGPFSGTTQVSWYQKGKTNLILLKQETVSGSGISWAVCKSAPLSRQITTLAPNHSVFLQTGCPSSRPTNSVKALKETVLVSFSARNTYYTRLMALCP